MLRIFRVSLCVLAIITGPGAADPVSRTLPALFEKEIQPQLTEVEPLLKLPPAKDAAATGGEVLLREQIVFVDENARRTDVIHQVYRAVTESGVNAVSRDVEGFHKKRSRIHLALARTLQPDGRKLPVRGEAAFIQTPQRSADSDLYDDQAEMVIIYPDVKKGSVAESMVVREELESRIPGQLTMVHGFSGRWPVQRDRFILEVPLAMADRIRLTTLGHGVPDPVRQEVKAGSRVRWTWERRNIPGMPQEDDRVSLLQTGPVVFITTLQGWEDFIAWYLPLAGKRMVLSDAMKDLIDNWTKEAASVQEVTDILLRKVASEVRYVGLEFGEGDLVPRDVNATWENQYGDCKDKACLLAAMLRHKGIRACPALINTSFPGRVEKRSPDFRHFDHSITAVKGPDGNWLFCDPTIPGLPPGGIGPADGDREVLLVQAGAAAQWARTPPHDFGLIRHRMDLRMDAAGALSGWSTIETNGYNAAQYAEREQKATPDSLRDALQSQLGRLSEGLSAVDIKKYPRRTDGSYRVDAFILIPGNGAGAVPFLADKGFVPQTGNEESRETAFASWREIYEAEASITLPSGLVPTSLPEPLDLGTAWAEARGSWQWKDGILTSKFRFHAKSTTIPPGDFPAFSRQMRAIHAWIGRELPLRQGDAPSTPSTPADSMESMPHLPTVDGQLLFVDNKYPPGGNAGLRRAALEKSISYFPGDQAMLYRAGSSLAWLEIRGGDPAAGLRRLDGFQDSCRAHVDSDEAALGDYFRAFALKDLGRKEEALAIYHQLAADEALTSFRRTWSCYQAGLLLEESSPAEALTVCGKGLALQDADAESILYPLWVRLMLKADRATEVETVLQKLAADRTETAPAILTNLAEAAPGLPEGQAPAFLELLSRIGPPEVLGQAYVKAISDAKADLQGRGTGDMIRQRLTAWLKEHPDTSGTAPLPDGVKTAAQMEETLAGQLESDIPDFEAAVKLGIGSIVNAPPGTNLSAALLNLMKAANLREINAADPSKVSPLLEELTGIAGALPVSDDIHHEGLYFLVQVHQRRHQTARMKETATRMIAGADAGRDWIAVAPLGLLVQEASETGDRDEVLKWCRELRRYSESALFEDAVFRESVVHLLNGDFEKGMATLDELAALTEADRKKMTYAEQADSLLTFVKADRDAAVKWWRNSANWWPAVLTAARQVHPAAGAKAVPLIASADTSAQEAGVAAGKKDFAPVADYLLRLTGAARLDPSYFAAYGGICSQSESLNLQAAKAGLCQSVCAVEPYIPAGPHQALLLLYVEEAWFRQEKWTETAAAAKRYFAVQDEPDRLSGFAARYWAVAAEQSGRDFPEVAGVFKKILDAKADPTERPRNLWLYALILTKDGRQDEARAVVRAELEAGQLDTKHPIMPQLREMADRIDRERTMNEQEIAGARDAVDHWLKVAAPPWFDWTTPTSLADPELKNPQKWLEDNTPARPASALKAAVLILRDSSQPQAVRETAISTFLSNAPVLGAGPEAQHKEWEAIFSHEGISEESRRLWLIVQLLKFTHQGWPRRVKPWLDHPLFAKADDLMQTRLSRMRRLLEIDPGDAPKLKAHALSLLKESIEITTLHDFSAALQWLLQIDPGAAAECLDELRSAPIIGEAAGLAETITLDTTQQIASAKLLEPVHAALLETFSRNFPHPVAAPPDAEFLAGEQGYPIAALDDARHLNRLRWRLQNRTFPRQTLEFWEQFVLFLNPQGKDNAIKLGLATSALAAANTDEAAAAAIGLTTYCLDMDDEVQRGQFTSLLKPFASKPDWSDTADWLTFVESILMLRTGAGTDAREAIDTIDDRLLKSRLIRTQMAALVANKQSARLKKFLAGTPSVTLLSPVCLPVSLTAWRSLGMKDEAAVAQIRQQTALRQMVETAWAVRDISSLNYAFHLMANTGIKELVPPGLEEDLPKWVAHPSELNDALFTLALLREDWETAARRGIQCIEAEPSQYSAYFHAATACAKSNRPDEARNYLLIYLEKTHDETNLPAAKALLEALPPRTTREESPRGSPEP